jgi:hypothetical protein
MKTTVRVFCLYNSFVHAPKVLYCRKFRPIMIFCGYWLWWLNIIRVFHLGTSTLFSRTTRRKYYKYNTVLLRYFLFTKQTAPTVVFTQNSVDKLKLFFVLFWWLGTWTKKMEFDEREKGKSWILYVTNRSSTVLDHSVWTPLKRQCT